MGTCCSWWTDWLLKNIKYTSNNIATPDHPESNAHTPVFLRHSYQKLSDNVSRPKSPPSQVHISRTAGSIWTLQTSMERSGRDEKTPLASLAPSWTKLWHITTRKTYFHMSEKSTTATVGSAIHNLLSAPNALGLGKPICKNNLKSRYR